MSYEIDLVGLGEMSVDQLQTLTLEQLHEILVWVKRSKNDIRGYEGALHQELASRFKARAAQVRSRLGKETGAARFTQDGFTVLADLPKRVEYDQKKLRIAVDELRAQGKDPLDYVAFEISITEAAWNGFDGVGRACFQEARTVKTGKQTFELIKLGSDEIADPTNDDSFGGK